MKIVSKGKLFVEIELPPEQETYLQLIRSQLLLDKHTEYVTVNIDPCRLYLHVVDEDPASVLETAIAPLRKEIAEMKKLAE